MNNATINIYEIVILSIKDIEKENDKYKQNIEDIHKSKILKFELSNLHEIRRTIERFENFSNLNKYNKKD
jgi:hypothetical protein